MIYGLVSVNKLVRQVLTVMLIEPDLAALLLARHGRDVRQHSSQASETSKQHHAGGEEHSRGREYIRTFVIEFDC